MSGEATTQGGLTDAQRQAVEHLEGPMLVLAGPGSGKTTVVTRRVAFLLDQGIPPWQVLGLTFTNKAAAEMRQRIDDLLPAGDLPRRGLTVTTFHAFCVRTLRRFAAEASLPARFTIYDASDQRDAIKRAIAQAGLSTSNWTPASVASAISGAKNRLLDAEAFADEAGDFYNRSIARAYRQYEKILRENEAVDFDDLLLNTATLLRDCPSVRTSLQDRYQYLLIDEYQDTNHAQFLIAHLLAAGHQNIMVVGDPDQAIYGWRGADIGNILQFEEHYPAAEVVPLGQNFRSTGHIVDAAAGVITNNRHRKHKLLSTELGEGEKPLVVICHEEHHEAKRIVQQLRTWHESEGIPWRSMAVLYRVNALSRVLEEAFRDDLVPYVIARGTEFYARKEVKDALAYLRLLLNPSDEIALRRIINTPPRGLGKTTLQRIEVHAANAGLRMLPALAQVRQIPAVTGRAVAAAERFVAMVAKWRADAETPWTAAGAAPLAQLVEQVVKDSGLEGHYRRSAAEEDQERLANLNELINAASEWLPPDELDETPTVLDGLLGYLEGIALVSDSDAVDPQSGAVTLMTLHTAKGLEFDGVAVAGLEAGLLPHIRAATDEAQLEEERRLFFVGLTRARRHLMVTSASVRTRRGIRERTIPSQFLGELPAENITTLDLSDDQFDVFDHDDYGADDRFRAGAAVHHPVFGPGRVETVTPRPAGSAARVRFDSVGVKTLILEYAKLRLVDSDAAAPGRTPSGVEEVSDEGPLF